MRPLNKLAMPGSRMAIVLLSAVLLLAGCQPKADDAAAQVKAPPAPAGAQGSSSAPDGRPAADAPAAESGSPADKGAPAPENHVQIGAVTYLKLEIENGTVVIKPAAAGEQPSARWDILPSSEPHAAPASSLKVTVEELGGELTVADEYTGPQQAQRPQLVLRIFLPPMERIAASLGNGELTIDGSEEVDAELGNGTLTLSGHFAACEASLGNGELAADLLLTAGEHRLSCSSGLLEIRLRPGSDVAYTAEAGLGKITLGGVEGKVDKHTVSQSASGTLGAGRAQLSVSSGVGEIRFTQ